jgi:hypothetical protein
MAGKHIASDYGNKYLSKLAAITPNNNLLVSSVSIKIKGRSLRKREVLPTSAAKKKAKISSSKEDASVAKKVRDSSSKKGDAAAKGKKKTMASSKNDKTKEMDAKILSVMLTFHLEDKTKVTVKTVADALGCNEKTKTFRERWSFLKIKRKLIAPGEDNNGLRLTKAGLDEAATPEYKAMMKDLAIVPKTNADHQEKIKKYLKKPKSIQIFDFLLQYGSLSKADLSHLVGVNHRSHGFHYSLKELRDKEYVEESPNDSGKGKKFRLSSKAFKSEGDQPKENDVDAEELATKIANGIALIESRKRGPRSEGGKSKKRKSTKNEDLEDIKEEETEPIKDEEMENEAQNEDTEEPAESGNEKEASIVSNDSDSGVEGAGNEEEVSEEEEKTTNKIKKKRKTNQKDIESSEKTKTKGEEKGEGKGNEEEKGEGEGKDEANADKETEKKKEATAARAERKGRSARRNLPMQCIKTKEATTDSAKNKDQDESEKEANNEDEMQPTKRAKTSPEATKKVIEIEGETMISKEAAEAKSTPTDVVSMDSDSSYEVNESIVDL